MSTFHVLAACARVLSILAGGLVLAGCYHVPSTPLRSRPSDERVDVGYGMQPAAHAGGSVQSAVAEDFKNERSGRAEELFSGRFSGVRVLRTVGGGLQVSIRGAGLWSADQQPLYVIDGVAVTVSSGRGLDWLVPQDIARIEVLKNAAETTMFGARGANGVVLITTRRPR